SSDRLHILAEAYRETKNIQEEIRVLKVWETKDSNRFRPHAMLGDAYHRRSKSVKNPDPDLTLAITHYRKAIAIAPRHQPSYEGLLEVYTSQKNSYEARQIIQDMIRAFGEKPQYFTSLCRIYADSGFLEQAVDYCQEAI